ncbi:MAG TPA: type I-E CRISPR-associated protein Cas7/Cse4/CasC [Methylococcus sp.]|nr:type I-E CRISPR-associated protein Cas7/Cse4/CasC [Methylococcus sp.]
MFLQIHTLTSYPASLLNRDDAGLAKRIPFGNATRLRVSSQCLKRHWRENLTQALSDVPDGLRTRSFFTRAVLPHVIRAGVPEDLAGKLSETLAKAVVRGGVKEGGDLNQPILFGQREADYFVDMLVTAHREANPIQALTERLKSKEETQNLAAMSKSAAGLTAALFGRMVTSDLLARVDAPVHVAHAFTVHPAQAEMDYFTVVDDLNRDDEMGAAHANQTELGAGVYYGYVTVDMPLLVSNLTGSERGEWKKQDAAAPRRVLQALIHAITRQSPGAKLGSTAPYSYADLVLLEAGTQQPRTLANAFLEAVKPHSDLRQQSAQRMADYLQKIDRMYGATAKVRTLSTHLDAQPFVPLTPKPVDDAIQQILDAIWE